MTSKARIVVASLALSILAFGPLAPRSEAAPSTVPPQPKQTPAPTPVPTPPEAYLLERPLPLLDAAYQSNEQPLPLDPGGWTVEGIAVEPILLDVRPSPNGRTVLVKLRACNRGVRAAKVTVRTEVLRGESRVSVFSDKERIGKDRCAWFHAQLPVGATVLASGEPFRLRFRLAIRPN